MFRALVYNKSAVVLHMLRRLVGDEAFFGGVRQFYADHRFKKAGTYRYVCTIHESDGMTGRIIVR